MTMNPPIATGNFNADMPEAVAYLAHCIKHHADNAGVPTDSVDCLASAIDDLAEAIQALAKAIAERD